jgi:hypothetical protein
MISNNVSNKFLPIQILAVQSNSGEHMYSYLNLSQVNSDSSEFTSPNLNKHQQCTVTLVS